MRFVFYSHDGMGLGHLRRNLAVARALISAAPETQVLLATSVDEVSNLGLPSNVDTLKLPGLRKVANDQYESRRLALDSLEIGQLRSALLKTAVESFRPDALVVDKHPFGAGGELRAALEAARALGARAVLGFRDILDDPATVRGQSLTPRAQEIIRDSYDRVLIYGLPSVFDTVRQYGLSPQVAGLAKYCGYVVNEAKLFQGSRKNCEWLPGGQERIVLATVGGGEDGETILKTFVQAAAGAPWKGIAVSGPLMSEESCNKLRQFAAIHGVAFHRFIPNVSNFFSVIDGLVCMGGYNTLLEAVSSGAPTVCVPRVFPRVEQLMRAEQFSRLGLVHLVHPSDLSAEKLREEISRCMQTPRETIRERADQVLKFDGAERAACCLLDLVHPSPGGYYCRVCAGEPVEVLAKRGR